MSAQEYYEKFKLIGEYFPDVVNNLRWAEMNRDRFAAHLQIIANDLGVEWCDGDFPIEEIRTEIARLRSLRK